MTGTGEEIRDFTYVLDIVDALLRAGFYQSAIGQEMNIASGQEIRIGWLTNKINELTGNTAGTIQLPQRRWDTKKRLLASIDRANELIGYRPDHKFEKGLAVAIEWFQ